MDELVSVPVTHPVRFLKGQRDKTIKPPAPDPPVRTQKSPPIRRPAQKLDPPTTSLQSTPVKKNLAQEWLDF